MTLTPLKNLAYSRLPHSRGRLTGLIPTNLKDPVNILILGIDNSGHPHQGKFTPAEALAGNSDTMLLVRLEPDTHKINVLSIPRDTLIHLKGVGIDKINDANVRGGPKQAAEAVHDLLDGVGIDRYIRLDTEGFIHLVDALGGVEVTIPEKMDYVDHTQKLNIHFSPGRQRLNGQHLQEYIRFRHDRLGDIGRVQRQQQVLKEILHTLLQPASLGKIPQLLEVVKDNVDSDLSVNEMLGIAHTLMVSDRQHMHLVMLPGRFSRRSEYKLSYWIHDPKVTSSIVSRYFNINTTQELSKNSDLTEPSLKIAVANGTGVPRNGEIVVSFLRKHGFRNAYATNINTITNTQNTQIIAEHGNPDSANTVSSVLGTGEVQVASVGDILSDVTIVVGPDLVEKLRNQKPEANRTSLTKLHHR
ncbi:LCP family protein [Aetokthonos hydrillicola Thurmond2011]|uniref:LCP family protein n=1 Tax=Aetokthonos hydrillicola Thurmond2011 TaxID=2712845 RepID=A0AAP5I4T5_9CYAN|nr:LCP family protein [Aetokthonos hydrillicola]MDR9893784.1 LCP family protein [Aetokthonos hydrillicola Thurmond2011]